MTRKISFLPVAATIAACLLSAPVRPAAASSSGRVSNSYLPASGCNQCHSGGTVPSVNLSGPTAVAPGAQSEFSFAVGSPGGQTSAGLNVFATAGTFAVGGSASTSTQSLIGAGGRAEITHSAPKAGSAGMTNFSFLWTAPSSFSSVTLNAWGNAVNLSNGSDGDRSAMDTLTVFSSANGGTCSNGPECLTGFCVDSVCCATSACGGGESCNVAGSEGMCAAGPTATPTATPSPTPTRFPIDDFKMYKAKVAKGAAKFTPPADPDVVDALDNKTIDVRKPVSLANPADSDGAGIINADIHLSCFQIKDSKLEPAQAKFVGQQVEVGNRLETRVLNVTKAAELCLAGRQLELVPPAPPAFTHNHFRCFKAKAASGTPAFTAVESDVVDEFETKTTTLLKPDRVCLAAEINGVPADQPNTHLVCYKAKDTKLDPKQSKFAGRTVYTRNTLTGVSQLTASKTTSLCVPSTATVLGPIP